MHFYVCRKVIKSQGEDDRQSSFLNSFVNDVLYGINCNQDLFI